MMTLEVVTPQPTQPQNDRYMRRGTSLKVRRKSGASATTALMTVGSPPQRPTANGTIPMTTQDPLVHRGLAPTGCDGDSTDHNGPKLGSSASVNGHHEAPPLPAQSTNQNQNQSSHPPHIRLKAPIRRMSLFCRKKNWASAEIDDSYQIQRRGSLFRALTPTALMAPILDDLNSTEDAHGDIGIVKQRSPKDQQRIYMDLAGLSDSRLRLPRGSVPCVSPTPTIGRRNHFRSPPQRSASLTVDDEHPLIGAASKHKRPTTPSSTASTAHSNTPPVSVSPVLDSPHRPVTLSLLQNSLSASNNNPSTSLLQVAGSCGNALALPQQLDDRRPSSAPPLPQHTSVTASDDVTATTATTTMATSRFTFPETQTRRDIEQAASAADLKPTDSCNLLQADNIIGRPLEERGRISSVMSSLSSPLPNFILKSPGPTESRGSIPSIKDRLPLTPMTLRRRTTIRRTCKRLVHKSGDCNISHINVPKQSRKFLSDIFTTLIDVKWRWSLLIFSSAFLLSWTAFAVLYYLICMIHGDFQLHEDLGPNFEWIPCIRNIESFSSIFLFSVETQHTIGYGYRFITETCPAAIVTMCIQSLVGIMIQSFMTGFVFAKLARPKKRAETLIFSKNAVICMRDGKLCFLYRVGDMRKSHIVEAHVRLQMIKKRLTKEGELLPFHQFDMNVGYDQGMDRIFLVWPITICHVIDEDSPLYDYSKEDLENARFEIVAILEGIVESTGMTTQARTSYLPSEILWGHRFEKLVTYQRDNGEYKIDFARFHITNSVETPTCSARELDEMADAGIFPTGGDYDTADVDLDRDDSFYGATPDSGERTPLPQNNHHSGLNHQPTSPVSDPSSTVLNAGGADGDNNYEREPLLLSEENAGGLGRRFLFRNGGEARFRRPKTAGMDPLGTTYSTQREALHNPGRPTMNHNGLLHQPPMIIIRTSSSTSINNAANNQSIATTPTSPKLEKPEKSSHRDIANSIMRHPEIM